MSSIIIWTIQLVLVPVLSPLFVGIIRKTKARLQNRVGASIFQPYYDLRKLFHKDEVISEDASWIFKFAPYIIFAVTVVVGAAIPLFITTFSSNLLGDLLTIVYLLALSTFFLALAGIDVGSAFGGFGSSREMTVAALTEGGLVFSILSLVFMAHSTNLFQIADAISSLSLVSFTPVLLAFIGFVIAMLAETARFPFDNPATHLELTMIHEAMILEYSARHLALVEWASSLKLFAYISIGIALFVPYGIAEVGNWSALPLAIVALLAKLIIAGAALALLEALVAKMRIFRAPEFLGTAFLLAVLGLLIHFLLGA
jgi:formate hydrogenlyase subunit 4